MLNDTVRRFLLPSDAITDTVHIRCCEDRVVTVGHRSCAADATAAAAAASDVKFHEFLP